MHFKTEHPYPLKYSLSFLNEHLDTLLTLLEGFGWKELVIETLLVQALLLQALGMDVKAMEKVESALSLAEPEGYVRMFLNEGLALMHILYRIATHGISKVYAGKLVRTFEMEKGEGFPRLVQPTKYIEPLSRREVDVLQLLAQGFSNKEIARQLHISPGTVKTHTAHIYDKLNVHGRGKAVARAVELDLL
jgi:LuxR family maltose regulon positive regulatory protein